MPPIDLRTTGLSVTGLDELFHPEVETGHQADIAAEQNMAAETADVAVEPVIATVTEVLSSRLISDPLRTPPASPAVMMPSMRELERSLTTGMVPQSVSHQPVQIPQSPVEEELDRFRDDGHNLYGDLPSLDPDDHSHISLQDLGMEGQDDATALHFSHSTSAGTV